MWAAVQSSPLTLSTYSVIGGPISIGWHSYCALSFIDIDGFAGVQVYPVSGPNAQGKYSWNLYGPEYPYGIAATCLD